MKSNKQNIQLIIPMVGIGQRFVNAGYKNIKPLIQVDGMPIIQHVLNLFPGIDDVIFICNKTHATDTNIKSILSSICPTGKIIEIDPHKKGPVYSVSKIFDSINDNKEIIVSYCDYSTEWDFDAFLQEIHDGNFDGSIPCHTGFHPNMLGPELPAFCKEHNKVLIQVKEKESFTDNKLSEYASNGTYYFKSGTYVKKYFQQLMDMDINIKGEYYASLVYNLMVADGLRTNIFKIKKVLIWGTPYDLENYKYWSDYFTSLSNPHKYIDHPTDTTLILPMAGRGNRFQMEGFDVPKPLIDVDGYPMVIQAVKCLPESKENIFICLKEHADKYDVKHIIKTHRPNSTLVELNSVTQGQAETCKIGIEESKIDPETPILISASDNGVFYDKSEYRKLESDNSIDVIVWSFRNNSTTKLNPTSYSWVEADENNFAQKVICKQLTSDPLKTHAITGTMFFRKAKYFLDGFDYNYRNNIRTNNEFYVEDILNRLIESGLKVKVFEVDFYICWGSPNDYKTYTYWNEFFKHCKWHPYKL